MPITNLQSGTNIQEIATGARSRRASLGLNDPRDGVPNG